jgi:DNA replication protein DnaC
MATWCHVVSFLTKSVAADISEEETMTDLVTQRLADDGATDEQYHAGEAKRKLGSARKPGGNYKVPFVEKYRPRTLNDVVGNEETLIRLRAIAKDGNVPHLILCGPPGTGKTTSVHALARELLGSAYKDAVLELNASDARGIDVCTQFLETCPLLQSTSVRLLHHD